MPTSTNKSPPLKPSARKTTLIGELEKYSIKELEMLAIELHEKYWKVELSLKSCHGRPKKDIMRRVENAPSLHDILWERQFRLNSTFKFTPKTIARFLKVNKLLAASLKKARHEARLIMLELERRLKKKDKFLHDYELEINLAPYVEKPGIYEVLESLTHRSFGDMTRSKGCLQDYYGDNGKKRDSCDLMNWNKCSGLHHKEFEKHHICYLMHELCDHSLWSFPDILKITSIWIDVKVWRQHFSKLSASSGN